MKKRGFVWLCMCGAAWVLSGCGHAATQRTVVEDFTPIIDNDGADPWILQTDDVYYYTKTTGNNLTLWRSEQLTDVAAGEEKVIWEMPADLENIWAPELHFIEGQWIVYFAVNKPSETHRMYALINDQADPYSGEWVLKAVDGMDDTFAIDGTVLTLGDTNYFIWSGWAGYENVAQNIYIAAMTSPTSVQGEKQLISEPEYAWEMKQTPLINEAPQVIIKENTVNLVYSGSGSWDNDYALGLLTMATDADPLVKDNWQKETEPIFQQTDAVFGPGHNGFAKSKDGTEDWLIYHAARWDHSGWARSIRLQSFTWDEAGKLVIDQPLGAGETQTLPAGEPSRLRLAAKEAVATGDLTTIADETALTKQIVSGFESTSDRLTFQAKIDQTGDYTVIAYVKSPDYLTLSAPIQFNMGNKEEVQTLLVPPSQYYQPIQVRFFLVEGSEEIILSSEIGVDTVQVDRLEIIQIDEE